VKDKIKLIIAFVAVAIIVGVLAYDNRTVVPKTADWDDVVAEAKRGGYRLIKTVELAKRYQKDPESILLVDTRQEWEYRTGHMKGAFNFPMEPTWLSRWRKKGELQKLLGPDKNRFMVFY